MEEVWKDIPGIPSHQASSLGRIRSKDRVDTVPSPRCKKPFLRKRKGKLLSQNVPANRYPFVSINDTTYLVHRIIAMTFLEKPHDKGHVNHLNGVKTDNRVENLEWCTPSENEKHSYKVLHKQVWNKGKHYDVTNAQKVRKENYIKKCIETERLFRESGVTKVELAKRLNMTREQVAVRIKVAKEVMGYE